MSSTRRLCRACGPSAVRDPGGRRQAPRPAHPGQLQDRDGNRQRLRRGPPMKARTHGAVLPTQIGYALSGLLGAGIIVIGARFLVAPQAAAAAYGMTNEQGGPAGDPYLAVKGVRDIASGVVAFVLLAAGKPHILGRYLAAA